MSPDFVNLIRNIMDKWLISILFLITEFYCHTYI